MRLDPEFAKVVNSLVMAAREASGKDRSDNRTVVENLRFLRAGTMRSQLAGKFGYEQESAVVGIVAPRILSSLQVIIDGMASQAKRQWQLNEGAQPIRDGALVELVGKGSAELFFAPDGDPAWVPSIGLLVAAVEGPAGWLGASDAGGPGKPRVDDDLRGDIACWFEHGRAHYPELGLQEDVETMMAILREYELLGDAIAYVDPDGMLAWRVSDTFHLEAGGGRCEGKLA
jgi:hypothetical protein